MKLSYPPGSLGTQANIKSVKVELPKNLPSRLTTLQKACTAKAFETNPASCPAESVIGHAVVHTQVLPVPLEGPAYFVSHGGEAFPSLEIVLQGYGVTVDLVGTTFITKSGITSTNFKTTPDVPFETFELTFRRGSTAHWLRMGICVRAERAENAHRFCGTERCDAEPGHADLSRPAASPRSRSSSTASRATPPPFRSRSHLRASWWRRGRACPKQARSPTGATTLTVKLTLTKGEAAFLGKHKGRKLAAKIKLTFTPKKGAKLKTSTTVLIG